MPDLRVQDNERLYDLTSVLRPALHPPSTIPCLQNLNDPWDMHLCLPTVKIVHTVHRLLCKQRHLRDLEPLFRSDLSEHEKLQFQQR